MSALTVFVVVFYYLLPTVLAIAPALMLLGTRRWVALALIVGGLSATWGLPVVAHMFTPPREPNDDWMSALFEPWVYAFWYAVLCICIVAVVREIDRPRGASLD